MFYYQLTHQLIASEFSVELLNNNLLTSTNTKPDLVLRKSNSKTNYQDLTEYYNWLNPDGSNRLSFFRSEGSYLLRYPAGTEFLISQDKFPVEITVKTKDLNQTIQHLLIDQVFPLFLSQQQLVLHSSAFAVNNQAYCLVAPSGNGKSTLVSLLAKNQEFISDDYACITEDQQITSTYPGYRTIQPKSDNLAKAFHYLNETSFTLNKNYPIKTIIFLNRNTKISPGDYQVNRLNLDQILEKLLPEVLTLNPDQSTEQVLILERITKLINSVKCQELCFSDLRDLNPDLLIKAFQ